MLTGATFRRDGEDVVQLAPCKRPNAVSPPAIPAAAATTVPSSRRNDGSGKIPGYERNMGQGRHLDSPHCPGIPQFHHGKHYRRSAWLLAEHLST